jgi:hypothetical protein
MTLAQEQIPWGAASMLLRRHADQAQTIAGQRISELSALCDRTGAAIQNGASAAASDIEPTAPLSVGDGATVQRFSMRPALQA